MATARSGRSDWGAVGACGKGVLMEKKYETELTKVVYRMTAAYLDKQPHLFEKWSGSNPLGRLGRPDELRGVIAWLASDASTFCTGSE
jgi:NAD(P)-dependent dehydrogenase (short-subunit alcohol dehydrogenase family)